MSMKKNEPMCGRDGISDKHLRFAIAALLIALILEIIGGIISNSLALLTDAGHVFLDLFAVVISFFAVRMACRPRTDRYTYGFHRMETMAALINSLTLLGISIVIIYEAYGRFVNGAEVKGFEMMLFALIGLVINLAVALRIGHSHDANLRSVYYHVIGDTLASVGVLAGGIFIYFTDQSIVDPILSLIIAGIIIVSALRVLRDVADIILERTPHDIDLKKLKKRIVKLTGASHIHDMHVWSICSNVRAMSVHLCVDNMDVKTTGKLRTTLQEAMITEYRIYHVTVQFECVNDDGTVEEEM